ncbi:MAG: globin [Caulobacteraceae bacterium]|nr:globin [Caulobacteraceae bacterium]
MDADLILRSFEIVAERRPDPAPLVYGRLFARFPDMRPLFVRDDDGSVKGEMLSRAFEAILDFIGRRHFAHTLIQCEVVTHEGYGVPPEVFGTFFGAIKDAFAEILGPDWTPLMAEAWSELLAELDLYVTHPDQMAPRKVA